ncbi:MAG: flagellar protein FlaG [Candidatus Eisenbacteria bacterium]|nr:flagellar protein FlaG [Candidatus Eisenbacteria bacterium]
MSSIEPLKPGTPMPTTWDSGAVAEPASGDGTHDAGTTRAPVRPHVMGQAPEGGEKQPGPTPVGTRVMFSVDQQLRETIIRVVDKDSGDVLRQIPTDEALRIRRAYAKEQEKEPDTGEGGVA